MRTTVRSRVEAEIDPLDLFPPLFFEYPHVSRTSGREALQLYLQITRGLQQKKPALSDRLNLSILNLIFIWKLTVLSFYFLRLWQFSPNKLLMEDLRYPGQW